MKTIVFFMLACGFSGGCVTQSSIESEPLTAGATRVYRSSVDPTINATRQAIPDAGLTIKQEKPVDGGMMFLTSRGVTGWSWGEWVRILVMSSTRGTIVRIVSQSALVPNVTAKNFTDDIFTQIGERLGE